MSIEKNWQNYNKYRPKYVSVKPDKKFITYIQVPRSKIVINRTKYKVGLIVNSLLIFAYMGELFRSKYNYNTNKITSICNEQKLVGVNFTKHDALEFLNIDRTSYYSAISVLKKENLISKPDGSRLFYIDLTKITDNYFRLPKYVISDDRLSSLDKVVYALVFDNDSRRFDKKRNFKQMANIIKSDKLERRASKSVKKLQSLGLVRGIDYNGNEAPKNDDLDKIEKVDVNNMKVKVTYNDESKVFDDFDELVEYIISLKIYKTQGSTTHNIAWYESMIKRCLDGKIKLRDIVLEIIGDE